MRPAPIFSQCVLTAFMALAINGQALSQASLMMEDRINEAKVKLADGDTTTFTIIRDAFERDQFYYMPTQPRLVDRQVDGKAEPEFHLIRFNLPDPNAPGGFSQGGILQFSAVFATPPETGDQLKATIKDAFKIEKDRQIRLAALPLKEATVSLYAPQSKEFLSAAPLGQGIAPTFATQKMVFSIPLTKIGAAVFDELTSKGKTGIGVCVVMKYQGLTPPVGYDVTVNWDQASNYLSTHDRFAARASWFGLFGASVNIDSKSILEELKTNSVVDVHQIDGEGANFDNAIQALIAQINQHLAVQLAPPDKIDPANAVAPDAGGFFGGVGYSRARVERIIKKTGTQRFTVKKRQLVDRTTVASGFIGIGATRYDWIRPKLVTDVTDTGFRNAYFLLPSIGDSEELGITQVNLQVELLDGNVQKRTETRRWTKDKGWTSLQPVPELYVAFPLDREARNLKFRETYTIVRNGRDMPLPPRERSVFDGQVAVAQPQSAVEVVVVDGSDLSFDRIDPKSTLQRAVVLLNRGDKKFGGTLVPYPKNDKFLPAKPLIWLIPTSGDGDSNIPVEAQVRFVKADGDVQWQLNGKNLRLEYPDPRGITVSLRDTDWKGGR